MAAETSADLNFWIPSDRKTAPTRTRIKIVAAVAWDDDTRRID
jgi:hypothetical protein